MRRFAILAAALAFLETGCIQVRLAAVNICHEPLQYLDDKKIARRLRKDAKDAWAAASADAPPHTCTDDFRDGFLDGYVDLIDNGGAPHPPIVPPIKYRNSDYLTPEGQAQMRDYLHGFKYGADVALETGKRAILTYPVVLPTDPPSPPLQINTAMPPAIPPAADSLPEALPAPRAVPAKP